MIRPEASAVIIALCCCNNGQFDWRPRLYWFFVASAIAVLISLLGFWVSPKIKERIALSRDRKFIAAELDRLQRLYARLLIFISFDDGRSLCCITVSG